MYLTDTGHFFENMCMRHIGCISINYPPKPEIQRIVLKEMIDFIHGMSKIHEDSFYKIMNNYTSMNKIFKRHTVMMTHEIGRSNIIHIVNWYERTFMRFMKEIQCDPQDITQLTIKIPRITAADLKTPLS